MMRLSGGAHSAPLRRTESLGVQAYLQRWAVLEAYIPDVPTVWDVLNQAKARCEAGAAERYDVTGIAAAIECGVAIRVLGAHVEEMEAQWQKEWETLVLAWFCATGADEAEQRRAGVVALRQMVWRLESGAPRCEEFGKIEELLSAGVALPADPAQRARVSVARWCQRWEALLQEEGLGIQSDPARNLSVFAYGAGWVKTGLKAVAPQSMVEWFEGQTGAAVPKVELPTSAWEWRDLQSEWREPSWRHRFAQHLRQRLERTEAWSVLEMTALLKAVDAMEVLYRGWSVVLDPQQVWRDQQKAVHQAWESQRLWPKDIVGLGESLQGCLAQAQASLKAVENWAYACVQDEASQGLLRAALKDEGFQAWAVAQTEHWDEPMRSWLSGGEERLNQLSLVIGMTKKENKRHSVTVEQLKDLASVYIPVHPEKSGLAGWLGWVRQVRVWDEAQEQYWGALQEQWYQRYVRWGGEPLTFPALMSQRSEAHALWRTSASWHTGEMLARWTAEPEAVSAWVKLWSKHEEQTKQCEARESEWMAMSAALYALLDVLKSDYWRKRIGMVLEPLARFQVLRVPYEVSSDGPELLRVAAWVKERRATPSFEGLYGRFVAGDEAVVGHDWVWSYEVLPHLKRAEAVCVVMDTALKQWQEGEHGSDDNAVWQRLAQQQQADVQRTIDGLMVHWRDEVWLKAELQRWERWQEFCAVPYESHLELRRLSEVKVQLQTPASWVEQERKRVEFLAEVEETEKKYAQELEAWVAILCQAPVPARAWMAILCQASVSAQMTQWPGMGVARWAQYYFKRTLTIYESYKIRADSQALAEQQAFLVKESLKVQQAWERCQEEEAVAREAWRQLERTQARA